MSTSTQHSTEDGSATTKGRPPNKRQQQNSEFEAEKIPLHDLSIWIDPSYWNQWIEKYDRRSKLAVYTRIANDSPCVFLKEFRFQFNDDEFGEHYTDKEKAKY